MNSVKEVKANGCQKQQKAIIFSLKYISYDKFMVV